MLHVHIKLVAHLAYKSNSIFHDLHESKFPQSLEFMCTSCSLGSLQSLERIQHDISGPIQPLIGLKIELNQFEWTSLENSIHVPPMNIAWL